MKTVGSAIAAAAADLGAAGIDGPGRDARRLMAHALGLPTDRLTLHMQDALEAPAAGRFAGMVAARRARRPLAQITGRRAFWKHEFLVTADVLDPRPETECLVAEALKAPFRHVLDLGTGSGCILLSLLAEAAQARGTGTDLSPAALDVARRNAERLGLADRAELRRSDWFEALTGRFDLIVSNPPYIAAAEMEALAPEVRLHEPRMALSDEGDGLGAYRAICAGAVDHLEEGGRLLVEIGPTQGQAVAQMMARAGLQRVRVLPDLDGRDRVVTGHWRP